MFNKLREFVIWLFSDEDEISPTPETPPPVASTDTTPSQSSTPPVEIVPKPKEENPPVTDTSPDEESETAEPSTEPTTESRDDSPPNAQEDSPDQAQQDGGTPETPTTKEIPTEDESTAENKKESQDSQLADSNKETVSSSENSDNANATEKKETDSEGTEKTKDTVKEEPPETPNNTENKKDEPPPDKNPSDAETTTDTPLEKESPDQEPAKTAAPDESTTDTESKPDSDEKPSDSGQPPVVDDTHPKPKKIIIISGYKESMARDIISFLTKHEIEPVIPQKDSDVIQDIDDHLNQEPDIGHAIILLSGDEFFYAKGQKPSDAKLHSNQTVTFELGFLLGKLGRDNVMVLYHEQKSYVMPTPYSRAMYISYNTFRDIKLWEHELSKKLTAWGYTLDPKKP